MRKIDKSSNKILSKKYKAWVDNKVKARKYQDPNNRYYYDDIVMNLYSCQLGVCAYTEMYICPSELYNSNNWNQGRYSTPKGFNRQDHFGDLEHFDPKNKDVAHWNWNNLFMAHAKINDIKSGNDVYGYLKPDLKTYSPVKYFEYDEQTHRFIPHTDIKDNKRKKEIQYMIDKILCLNHGVVRNERRDYINLIKDKIKKNEPFTIDRFFTSINWVLGI